MEPNTLASFYDDLKNRVATPEPAPAVIHVGNGIGFNKPGANEYRMKCVKHANCLRDDCRKHILLDIYCKILPADEDWADKNMSTLKGDIDNMLATKGLTPTQYLTSAYESTRAPLIDYILRSTDSISKQYLEDAEDTLKNAGENDVDLTEPEKPDTDSQEISSQLVDVKDDMEYTTFVDELKKKTIAKIVSDISDIIENEKDKNDMTFDTSDTPGMPDVSANESAVALCMDWASKKMLKENKEIDEAKHDELLGLAIREATLREIDNVFNVACSFNEFTTRINFNKGIVMNESAFANL